MNKALLGVGVVLVAALAAGGYYLSRQPTLSVSSVSSAPLPVAWATPMNVTIQAVSPPGSGGLTAFVPMQTPTARKLAYADPKGLTLYTYDKDAPGKSNCAGECAAKWIPATVEPNTRPAENWTVISREDGAKQWAYRGKPLYTSTKDSVAGDQKGNGDENGAWHTAAFRPADEMILPFGVGLREVADANGQVLVDSRNMTLYFFDGDPNKDRPVCQPGASCPDHWAPFVAPQLAIPAGDFSFVTRQDGIRQWAYKGKPLYTFDGDAEPDDANGIGVDKQRQVARVMRYFVPDGVRLWNTAQRGNVLATSDGLTLYRRDSYTYQVGGHSLRHALPPRASVGHALGTATCDVECLKTFRPLTAAADARPSGYWEVATRDDGTKQWVYQGYALYTYLGDKKPGDMTGNDIYEFIVSEDPRQAAKIPTPEPGAGSLFWTYAAP